MKISHNWHLLTLQKIFQNCDLSIINNHLNLSGDRCYLQSPQGILLIQPVMWGGNL
jgi:hypothetical protein